MFLFSPTTYSQDNSTPVILEQQDTMVLIFDPEPDSLVDTHTTILQRETSSKQLILEDAKSALDYSRLQKKYAIGTNLTKAGLTTGLIGSGLISAAFVYALTNFDPWATVFRIGVTGISFSIVSVQLTTTGFIIKGINKRKMNKLQQMGVAGAD
jgi:hypothetical protein